MHKPKATRAEAHAAAAEYGQARHQALYAGLNVDFADLPFEPKLIQTVERLQLVREATQRLLGLRGWIIEPQDQGYALRFGFHRRGYPTKQQAIQAAKDKLQHAIDGSQKVIDRHALHIDGLRADMSKLDKLAEEP